MRICLMMVNEVVVVQGRVGRRRDRGVKPILEAELVLSAAPYTYWRTRHHILAHDIAATPPAAPH